MKIGKASVVIPAHNEGDNLVDTVACILANTTYPEFEIIVVDDASTDGCGDRALAQEGAAGRVSLVRQEGVGIAGARNYGARQATGDAVVFLDAHCYTPPGWLTHLVSPLEEPAIGMVGPAFASLSHGRGRPGLGVNWCDASLKTHWFACRQGDVYPVPLHIGACQALRRQDFLDLGCYDPGMTRWGSEDLELCLRVWLMGYQVVGQPRTVIYHLFRQSHPYEVDTAKILYNLMRMALLHLSPERTARVVDHYKGHPQFAQVMMWLLESDIMEQRQYFHEKRIYDDDWFCAQFECPI